MKLINIFWISLVLLVSFTACGGGGGGSSSSESTPQTHLSSGPINSGNIPAITPSSQTSDEIISAIKQGGAMIPYEEIETNIKLVSGVGPYYAADVNGKAVFLVFTADKYFGKNNWTFCHESDGGCHREIDTTGNQRFSGATQFAGGKLYMLNLDKRVDPGKYGRTLAYYDPNTKELNKNALDINGLDGETGAISLGTDGYLYLGASNFLKSTHYVSYARVNPNDLTDYSYHTDYYKDLSVNRLRDIAADDTHVYQAMGDGVWELIAINQSTQKSVKLLEAKKFELLQIKDGVGLKYTDLQGVAKKAWLYNGQLTHVDTLDSLPPWYVQGVTPDNHPRDNPTGYWPFAEYWDIAPGVSKPKSIDLRLTTYPIAPFNNEIKLGVEIEGQAFTFTSVVDTYPQLVSNVQKIDDNTMMIKGRSYSGSAIFNVNDESSDYLGSLHISSYVNKPFFDYSSNEKKFIFSGYPSAKTGVYSFDASNKRFSSENLDMSLGYLRNLPDRNNPGAGINIDIHRPTDMVQIDETVYIIGMQYRSGVGGALVAWNTLTGEKYAIKKGIFDNYQPRRMIRIGDKLAIATQAMDNTPWGGSPRPSTPKIFIFDPKSQKIVKEYTPVEGLPTIDSGRIQSLDGRHIIGFTNNGSTSDNNTANYSSKMFLYIIDTYTDKVVMKKTINKGNYMRVEPHGSALIDGFHFIANNDHIYTWMDSRTLVTIDKNGEVEAHGRFSTQTKMAFANGNIYMTGTEKLRKIQDPK